MKTSSPIATPTAVVAMQAFSADAPAPVSTHGQMLRYMIERTFPAGALEGINDEVRKQVRANNASVGVRWVQSFSNASKTRTYCIYEGPSEAAIRQAAELNQLPVDRVTEVPVTLLPN